ncbi:MAG TPA: thioredoxin family protein [Candidatus Fournierella excrementavium]|mgnify:FL=1|nr:thioredoxin family protein [Candidatus Fournierella excrementavium]
MGLFGKKKEEKTACGCAGGCNAPAADTSRGIFVLGGGCAKCNELEAAVRAALAELGRQEEVGHVTDFVQIAALGVMATPALLVDGKVLASGRVLKKDEVKALLQQA